jgi:hypothetical protein
MLLAVPAFAEPIGEPPITSTDIDVNSLLAPTKAIPPDNGIDPVGAFRFICGAGQLSNDDPIVFPGQHGKSHLHQFYGNLGTNANSTYKSQRTSGGSSCGNELNRSGYWMPALLDGKGYVVEPDYVSIYYKRLPASDPHCNDPSDVADHAEGICVPIPVDLKMTWGYDMVTDTPPTGHHHFACVARSTPIATGDTLAAIAAHGCPAGDVVEAMISAPVCWDGQRTDSPNHRDHVSYPLYGSWGYLRCDAAHPYLMPTFTLGAFYRVQAGDDLKLWHFSSDEMRPGVPAGTTFHADYWEGWQRSILMRWTENCIDRHLDCVSGQLGDGYQIKGAWAPAYGYANPNARVPVPPRP